MCEVYIYIVSIFPPLKEGKDTITILYCTSNYYHKLKNIVLIICTGNRFWNCSKNVRKRDECCFTVHRQESCERYVVQILKAYLVFCLFVSVSQHIHQWAKSNFNMTDQSNEIMTIHYIKNENKYSHCLLFEM